MKKIAIAVHGGAGPDSPFIKAHKKAYEKGIEEALEAGYNILQHEGSAVEAVEAAICALENNPLFNAGRGSAINAKGEVEMCASVMDGKTLNSGAVAIVKNVKNPVMLARSVMQNTKYIYLGGEGALDYAKRTAIELEPDSYFVTEHQYDEYEKKRKEAGDSNRQIAEEQINNRMHGTVGAVALDIHGNLAAATSTGGTAYCKEGRIADSSMVGVGTYASNETCAVSCTGDGEYLIRGVLAHSVSEYMRLAHKTVKEACKHVVHTDHKNIDGDMGVIALDQNGNVAMEFNCARMHRGWITAKGKTVKIYRDE